MNPQKCEFFVIETNSGLHWWTIVGHDPITEYQHCANILASDLPNAAIAGLDWLSKSKLMPVCGIELIGKAEDLMESLENIQTLRGDNEQLDLLGEGTDSFPV
jgi:hypothetical protein